MVDFSAVLNRLPGREQVAASMERVPAVRSAASPFVAGVDTGAAADVVDEVHRSGMSATLMYLPGPDPYLPGLLAGIDALVAANLAIGTDLLVDLSGLGLSSAADVDSTRTGLESVCRAAAPAGCTVTIASPAHGHVGAALAMRARLAEDHPDLGISVAANLLRGEADCGDLARAGARVRLERQLTPAPVGVAVGGGREIDRAFVRCTRVLTEGGARTTVATDDPRLTEIAGALAARNDSAPLGYEFRLGMVGAQAHDLVLAGASVSVVVPFGAGWSAYIVRQVPARPTSLVAAARAALRGQSQ